MVPKKKFKFLICAETPRILDFIPLSLTYFNASSQTDSRVSKFSRILCQDSAGTVHIVGESARIAPGETSAFNFEKISLRRGESFTSFLISLAVFKESPISLIVFIVSEQARLHACP